jgi:SRSO17 transposase
MERRYDLRMKELMAEAVVPPQVFLGMLSRLTRFVEPFGLSLGTSEQRRHTQEYVAGLLSNVRRKNIESLAYLYDQERRALQKFIGECPWDHRPLLELLACQVGQELGEPDGVIVFDPSAFPKKGTKSAGVARQWCGRLGKVENCQVGIYMGYVSRKNHALVNMRLYLPREWTKDRKRCKAAGIPSETKFRTRHELALEMLDNAGSVLPHEWVAGDDEMGRSSGFRQDLRERSERYILAVPSNTLVRDLDATPPLYTGRGRPSKTKFMRVDRWRVALPESAWTKIDVRDGEKEPLRIEAVSCRVQARTDQKGPGPDEVLFITRELHSDGKYKHDYYLSNADSVTRLSEFARVTKAAHRIEEGLKRGKSEAGLGDYEVRTWKGWHHHQALSLLAAWFLIEETRREKNDNARDNRPADSNGFSFDVATGLTVWPTRENRPQRNTSITAQREGPPLPLQTT